MRDVSKEWQKIQPEALRKDFATIVAGSHEETVGRGRRGAAPGAPGAPRAAGGKTPNLDQYTVNLTEQRQGRQDRSGARPRFRDPADHRHPDAPPPEQPDPHRRGGRRQDRRGRRLRPAHRRRATCRRRCKNVTLRTLDLALLQAGAGIKGEFENRLKGLIEEVKSSPTPDHPVHRRGAHHDRRRRRRPGRATPPTCSSRRWRAASCAPSPPPPGPSTRSTSRRTPRWRAASRWSRWRSPTESKCMVMLRGIVPVAREAPQRAHPRRRPGRRGAALAPLPRRTASCPTRP